MATGQAATLNREHRRKQQAIRVSTTQEVTRAWEEIFDVNDVNRSFRALERELTPIIMTGNLESAQTAATFFKLYRTTLLGGNAPSFNPVRADEPDIDRVKYVLGYSGRIGVLKSIKVGKSPAQAARAGLVNTIGDSTRLVSEGGRQTVARSTVLDPQAKGYERVTGGDSCAFCSMLAARGPVFTKDSVDFQAHRYCACEGAPVFGKWTPSQQQQEWRDLYSETARGSSNPVKAFRDAHRERYSQ